MLDPYTATIEKIEENYTGHHNRKIKVQYFFTNSAF